MELLQLPSLIVFFAFIYFGARLMSQVRNDPSSNQRGHGEPSGYRYDDDIDGDGGDGG